MKYGYGLGISSEGGSEDHGVPAPMNTAAPVLTGTGKIGSALNSGNGSWDTTPSGYEYRWVSNGVIVDGQSTSSYNPTSIDDGKGVYAEVRAAKDGIYSTWVPSNVVAISYNAPTKSADLALVRMNRDTATGAAIDFSSVVTGSGLSWDLAPGSDALPNGISRSGAVIASGQTPSVITKIRNVKLRASNSGGYVDVECPIVVNPKGSVGRWLGNDLTQLRQAVNGTGASPAAVNDPVGYVMDLSGAGIHLASPNDANRLALTADGISKATASTRNVQKTAVAMMKNVAQFGFALAVYLDVNSVSLGAVQHLFSINDGVTGGTVRLSVRIDTDGKVKALFRRADGGSSVTYQSAAIAPAAQWFVISGYVNFATNAASIQVNALTPVTTPAAGTLNGTAGANSANTDSLGVLIGYSLGAINGPAQVVQFREVDCLNTVDEVAVVRDYLINELGISGSVTLSGTIPEQMLQRGTGDFSLPLGGYFTGEDSIALVGSLTGVSVASGNLVVDTDLVAHQIGTQVTVRGSVSGGSYADQQFNLTAAQELGIVIPYSRIQGLTEAQLDWMFTKAVELGYGWLRTDFSPQYVFWDGPSTTNTPYWTIPDRIFNRANAAGLKVLACPSGTWRPWAVGSGDARWPFANLSGAVDSVIAAANRYSGKVQIWQAGNENNFSQGVATSARTSPANAITWMNAFANGLRASGPAGITLVGGSIATASASSGVEWGGREYLTALYDSGLAGLDLDYLSFQSYPGATAINSNETWFGPKVTEDMCNIITARGGDFEVIMTEIGFTTGGTTGTAAVSVATAAERYPQLYKRIAAIPRVAKGLPIFDYELFDMAASGASSENYFGRLGPWNASDYTTGLVEKTAIANAVRNIKRGVA